MFFWPNFRSSFRTPDHFVRTSSFSRNESICFFISCTTAGVSPASIKIFFSRPCSLSHTISEVLRNIKTFVFTFRLRCTQCKIIGFLVKRIMNPNIMFLLFPTSPTFSPWTRGQIRVHRQVPHLRSKVKMETVNVFLHKPKHCDSHYAELKIPNGSLLQSEATTSSL